MSMFGPPVELASPLQKYRILAPTAGVPVSPLCLGTMNFGDAWKEGMGECNKQTTFEILDYFYSQGGNFLDLANFYQNEESEEWVGEWLEERGVRDQMVLATKYTTNYQNHLRAKMNGVVSGFGGNNAKSMHLSLEASLKKLRTSYVDILYVHWWDYTTSIEEVMQGLNRLVQAGKVLYLGASDMPAWLVAKGNQYARMSGMKQFSLYQGVWSAAKRDMERDIVPMCEEEGMAIAPYGVLGQGAFKTVAQRESDKDGRKFAPNKQDHDAQVSAVLEKIAESKGTTLQSIAMAFVRHQSPYNVFPIVGGRKVSHLKDNIAALKISLTREEIDEIEGSYPFDFGFPTTFAFKGTGKNRPSLRQTAADVMLTSTAIKLDIRPKLASLPEAGA